jgi:hypothetical protein
VAETDRWSVLRAERFAELPFDCGRSGDPGVRFSEELRDWSDKATTPDQRRMERYIDRYDLRQKRILHIGIGNSGLAERFHGRVKEIVGTTIDEPEMKVGRSLGLPYYRFAMHNKFSGNNVAIDGTFDFILDNNPTSPCCCMKHLATLFEFYAEKLAPDGQIVTDRQGLQWVPEGSSPRWGFSFEDLAAAAAVVGLSAHRANQTVYVMSQSAPSKPTLRSLSKHGLRRAASLSVRAIRRLLRLVRRTSAR